MENIQTSYGTTSRWLRASDLVYPCNHVADRHKYYCYDLVPGRVLAARSHRFREAIKWCRKSEPDWVVVCFQGLGREASGFTRLNPDGILGICRQAGDQMRACIVGGVRDMVYTDVSARRGKVLCAKSPAAARPVCWEGIGSMLGPMYNASAPRKSACDAATTVPLFRRNCYRGAHVDGYS